MIFVFTVIGSLWFTCSKSIPLDQDPSHAITPTPTISVQLSSTPTFSANPSISMTQLPTDTAVPTPIITLKLTYTASPTLSMTPKLTGSANTAFPTETLTVTPTPSIGTLTASSGYMRTTSIADSITDLTSIPDYGTPDQTSITTDLLTTPDVVTSDILQATYSIDAETTSTTTSAPTFPYGYGKKNNVGSNPGSDSDMNNASPIGIAFNIAAAISLLLLF